METDLEYITKRLWLTYKLYHKVAVRNGSDGSQYATESTNGFLEYMENVTSGDTGYMWDIPLAIENQIRILTGFIECYDKPVVRDKITNKTRWTV